MCNCGGSKQRRERPQAQQVSKPGVGAPQPTPAGSATPVKQGAGA